MKKKKKYKKPKIKKEKIITTTALACGKCVAGTPIFEAGCSALPRFS